MKQHPERGKQHRHRHKHCHESCVYVPIPEGAKKIVLAGNPNTGKSVFFNFLTGVYVEVSNYPGTTLDISSGRYKDDVVLDTPGVYGLSSFNDEERVARDVILGADLVLNVVDAVHLERDLFLTQQIIDTGVPVVVALNMMDEAENQNLQIDAVRLADLLGVPVIPTVAVQKRDLHKVAQTFNKARRGQMDPELKKMLDAVLPQTAGNQGDALLLLEGDPAIAGKYNLPPGTHREEIYLKRRQRIDAIIRQVLHSGSEQQSFSQKMGRLMLGPVTGWLILALALWVTFQFIGVFVAGTVVGFTEETIMAGAYEPWVRSLITPLVAAQSVLGRLLIGEFGLLTMTVTYLLGLLLPLVAGFYLMLSIFEDSGYLPRIATLVDRAMNAVGLNGKAVIPLILGFGCVTVATITTRLLGSERERRIAIFLLGLAIPCSAQLGVIAGLLSNVGLSYTLLYGGVIIAVLVITGTLLKAVIPGRTMDLMINLPPLRLPRLENVLKKTYTKSIGFLAEAAPLFALGAVIITVLQVSGTLEFLQASLAPLTTGWLGLPAEAANAFIMGVIRRDFGAAGLSDMGLNPLQTVVSLITITLFVPCIASIMVMFKERSKTEATIMWLSTWVIAFLTGGIVNQLAK
ncbi:MAG TPA: ferrous iron transport protein B, partial [Bacillota bacterium]|nr:ferrous iron transport protein B [Bacillota bacterium]